MMRIKLFLQFSIIACLLSCAVSGQKSNYSPLAGATANKLPVITAADQTNLYINYLKGKNVGMVINQTSIIGKNKTLSLDSLVKLGIAVKKIYGPEHGFRGDASNGTDVNNSVDTKTGVPVISIYGNKHFKPTAEDLKGIDILIYDIQDVGARFYTYLSTLQYVMEACAENNIELMILDRPNPNGFYVDGPVLDTAYRSFVGMNPIPVVHGLTTAEYAQMLNGEGWLTNHEKCKLKIIKVANYKHSSHYVLPVNPSPNLNTDKSILLYPSVCLFEGTTLSLGRGTMQPFLQIGHPALTGKYTYAFTPVSIKGMSEDPPQKNKTCYGLDLKNYDTNTIYADGKLNLAWLIELYKAFPDKEHFFNAYFTKLTGTTELRKQIEAGKSEAEIRSGWEPALSNYKTMRLKYLLYQ
ncbi:exo-beta-N-acetylmuramidase NamZ family protein [Mucilaginibacter xinganensis]|nr:DUF1343 domain-containing protein [Mucilaginibacter xinganensis]